MLVRKALVKAWLENGYPNPLTTDPENVEPYLYFNDPDEAAKTEVWPAGQQPANMREAMLKEGVTQHAVAAILVSDPSITPEVETLDRDFVRPTLSPMEPIIGQMRATVTFTTELKTSALATLSPTVTSGDLLTDWQYNATELTGGAPAPIELMPLFRACGLKQSQLYGDGATQKGGVVFSPRSEGPTASPWNGELESISIWIWMDEYRYEIMGCRGTYELTCEAGQFGRISWTFTGFYNKPVATTIPEASELVRHYKELPSQIARVELRAQKFVGGAWSDYAPPLVLQSVTKTLNAEISPRTDIRMPYALRGFRKTARNPEGTINPEAETGHDIPTVLEESQKNRISVSIPGRAPLLASDIVALKIKNAIFTSMTWGDREGMRIFELPFRCAAATPQGDDEFAFYFGDSARLDEV